MEAELAWEALVAGESGLPGSQSAGPESASHSSKYTDPGKAVAALSFYGPHCWRPRPNLE